MKRHLQSAIPTMNSVKRAESRRNQSSKQLKQVNALNKKFLSFLSHEIRGSIGNVISAVDFLKSGRDPSQEEVVKMASIIEAQARKALSILSNTTHYLQVSAQELTQHNILVHLPSFLAKLEQRYLPQTGEKLAFSCCALVSANQDWVKMDPIHTMEILEILINNAFQFTSQGLITLSLEYSGEGLLRFTISDTGPGIEKQYLNNIFKTFVNPEVLENEATYLKTGLKLPLAQRIAEWLGGNLQIMSEVGVGTTVCLDLPYEPVQFQSGQGALDLNLLDGCQEEENAVLSHSKDDYFPFNILLVEDDLTNAALETKALTRLGCSVTHADTASQAMDCLRSQTFDLIFVDITLPDMTGVALVDSIRPIVPESTGIVAVTSHSSEQDHDYFLKHGMMTMLSKPLTEAQFQGFFQGYLRMLDSTDE